MYGLVKTFFISNDDNIRKIANLSYACSFHAPLLVTVRHLGYSEEDGVARALEVV